MQHHGQNN
jgi:hypothetical protein